MCDFYHQLGNSILPYLVFSLPVIFCWDFCVKCLDVTKKTQYSDTPAFLSLGRNQLEAAVSYKWAVAVPTAGVRGTSKCLQNAVLRGELGRTRVAFYHTVSVGLGRALKTKRAAYLTFISACFKEVILFSV